MGFDVLPSISLLFGTCLAAVLPFAAEWPVPASCGAQVFLLL